MADEILCQSERPLMPGITLRCDLLKRRHPPGHHEETWVARWDADGSNLRWNSADTLSHNVRKPVYDKESP